MLEIKGKYNYLKIEINDYIKKEIRRTQKIDENDCWCGLHIYIRR